MPEFRSVSELTQFFQIRPSPAPFLSEMNAAQLFLKLALWLVMLLKT